MKLADISPPPPPTSKETFDSGSTPTTEPTQNDRQQQERLMDLNFLSSSSSEEDKESENEQERNIGQGKLIQKRLRASSTSSDNIEHCKKAAPTFTNVETILKNLLTLESIKHAHVNQYMFYVCVRIYLK